MILSPEVAPMLVSGARAKPARRLQRRRARICARKRRTLATTGAGEFPARTCSKCLRERSFSPFRKSDKERPGQLQADPHQLGAVDQHGVERGDGLVQQGIALVVGEIGLLRRPDRRQAYLEEHVGIDRLAPGQRT